MTEQELNRLERMALAAIPFDDDDWGSDAQIIAQNAFFDAAEACGLDTEDFATMKADVNDMVAEACRRCRLLLNK